MPDIRKLSILFADTDGYAAFCESHTPNEVHADLDVLLTIMSGAVLAHGGVVDKYLGDGLMARFDDPQPALDAGRDLLAGIASAIAAGRLRATTPRCAIHLGDVAVGDLGGPGHRELTAVGHAVNVAARLVGEAGKLGARMIVSADAVAALRRPPADLIATGALALKGSSRTIDAWKLP